MDKTFNQVAVTTDTIPDNEIMNRVLSGERDLYAVLVRRYNQRLYRVAISITNDENETEEAMQVAYIKAFENLGTFGNKSAFSTWLTRILINECLQSKRKRQLLAVNNDIENEIHLQTAHKSETPLTAMVNTELKTILEKTINELPEKYKTVFVMRELENMSIAETQECLGLSAANVKVRLNRAKAVLKNRLNELYTKDLLSFHLSRCDRVTNNVMSKISKINTPAS